MKVIFLPADCLHLSTSCQYFQCVLTLFFRCQLQFAIYTKEQKIQNAENRRQQYFLASDALKRNISNQTVNMHLNNGLEREKKEKK